MFSGRIVQKYTCSVVLHRSQEVIPAGMRRSARVTAKKSLLGSAAAVVEDAIQSSQPRVKRARVVAATAEVDNEPATGHSRTPPAKEPKGISWYHEQLFWDRGFSKVAGVDEAGRGPLAGPVVAAACILPKAGTDIIEGINDSKQLSAEERDSLYEQITTHPEVIWAAKAVDVETIDRINILQATMLAMELAVEDVVGKEKGKVALLVDGNRLPKKLNPDVSKAVIKGDTKSFAIAAASIIAKVTRDRMMDDLHAKFPEYNFAKHKGYGVPEHCEAIRKHGPCPEHRRTFAPVKHWFPAEAGKEEGS